MLVAEVKANDALKWVQGPYCVREVPVRCRLQTPIRSIAEEEKKSKESESFLTFCKTKMKRTDAIICVNRDIIAFITG